MIRGKLGSGIIDGASATARRDSSPISRETLSLDYSSDYRVGYSLKPGVAI